MSLVESGPKLPYLESAMHSACRTLPALLMLLLLVRPAPAQPSLRHKIGQMMLVGFPGQTVPDSLAVDLRQRALGGVIVMGSNGNLANPAQIRALTDSLRSKAAVPPFIAVDQEGGLVARLNASNGFAGTRTAYALGSVAKSVDSTRAQALLMSGWIRDCGINLNFAPVVDVNVNPSSPAIGYYGRSFSADPAVVTAHARAFIRASHETGVLTSTKHFPGHGSASTDSHLTLPDITSTWIPGELEPYRDLLATNDIDMVMMGHLYHAAFDPDFPTSLSSRMIDGQLRDSLGWDGVVITDAMGMSAISGYYGMWDAAELAVNAGVDILLYTSSIVNNASLVRQMVDTLEARVGRGRIAESRIDQAYGRISRLKERLLATSDARPFAATEVPARVRLSSYPNPFNPSTTVAFDLPSHSRVTVRIYDLLGRLVETLVDGEYAAGPHIVPWTPDGLSGGVYLSRLEVSATSGSFRNAVTARMVYLR